MFKPDIYVETIHDIDYESLQEKGIKLLAFDLDNTLDKPDDLTKVIDKEVENTLDNIESMGFDILIISNNTLRNRVSSFANLRNYKYIEGARKPFQKKYKNHEHLKGYKKHEIAFIGDKVVTDVVGGNIFGSTTILVDPLHPLPKKWYTFIMFIIEVVITFLLGFKRGKYYE